MFLNSSAVVRGGIVYTLVLLLAACSGSDPVKSLAKAKEAFAKRDYNTASIELKNALQQNPQMGDARVLFGEVLLEQGDPVGAEKELRKALDAGQTRERVLPLLAIALNQLGESKKLLTEFDGKQLNDNAATAALDAALGFAHLQQGDRDKAKLRFDEALRLQARQPDALLGEARLQAIDKKYDEALASVGQVISAKPEMLDALLLKGDLLAVQNKQEEAIAAYDEAIQAKPGMVRPYQSVIAYLVGIKRYDEAHKRLQALQKVAPKHPQTSYFKGVLAIHEGKFDVARDALLQVLKVAPEHLPAALLAAMAHMRLGEHVQAQDILQRMVVQHPDGSAARKMLAESYIATRDALRAIEVLQPLLKEDNKDPQVFNLAGQAYLLAGDFDRSSDYFSRFVALQPNNAAAHTRLGLSQLAKGDDVPGLRELEAAAAMDTSNVQADVAIVMAYIRKNDLVKAQQAVAAMEKKQPDNPLTQNVKGLAMLAVKNPAQARAAFEKALALQPNFLAAAVNLARLDILEKHPEQSRQRFEAIIEKNPQSTDAYLVYAKLLPELGGSESDVQKTLERAVTAAPGKPDAHIALVRFYMEKHHAKQALIAAQQAQAALPNDTEIMLLLARTQGMTGDIQQAVATYNKLITLQPEATTPLIEISDALRVLDDNTGAEQNLRKALSLKADLLEAQQRLIGLLAARERYSDALAIAKQVQKQRPNNAAGFALEAEIQGHQRHWPETIAALKQALGHSRIPILITRLHGAYAQSGKRAEADKLVADWFKEHPKELTVHSYLAAWQTEHKQYAAAAAEYKAMLAIAPEAPGTLNNLAWVSGKAGDPKALEYAEKAYKLAPNVPPIMETLGTLLVAKSDKSDKVRGLDLLKKAAEMAPRSVEIRLGYAKALINSGDQASAKREIDQILQVAPPKSKVRDEAEQLIKTL